MNNLAEKSRIRWWIAGLMWLAIAINYIDRTVLSAAAPHLIDELKLDPEMMGFIMAAFFWSYSLLQIPAGWFADRFGQKKGLGIAVAWWSIATSMMGWPLVLSRCWHSDWLWAWVKPLPTQAMRGSPHDGSLTESEQLFPGCLTVPQNSAEPLPCR